MMDWIYALLDALLPFEFMEFRFMKNALLAVVLITPPLRPGGHHDRQQQDVLLFRRARPFSAHRHRHRRAAGGGQLHRLHARFRPAVRPGHFGRGRFRRLFGGHHHRRFLLAGIALGIVLLSFHGAFPNTQLSDGDILSITPRGLLLLLVVLVLVLFIWVSPSTD